MGSGMAGEALRTRRTGRAVAHGPGAKPPGQALVEFAFAATLFSMLVFGTTDFGRAIFMYSELQNGVREGARYAKVKPTDTAGIRQRVVDKSPAIGLTTGNVTVGSCSACEPGKDTITVEAALPFQAVTQQLLGIAPFTMTARAQVTIE